MNDSRTKPTVQVSGIGHVKHTKQVIQVAVRTAIEMMRKKRK